MSQEIVTFFRHCPSCGRRFEIRLVGKKETEDTVTQSEATLRHSGGSVSPAYADTPFHTLEEKVALTIEVMKFTYTYKCKHCGHMWTELRSKEKTTELPLGSGG